MNFLDTLFATIEETHDIAGIMLLVCLYIAAVVTYIACKK